MTTFQSRGAQVQAALAHEHVLASGELLEAILDYVDLHTRAGRYA